MIFFSSKGRCYKLVKTFEYSKVHRYNLYVATNAIDGYYKIIKSTTIKKHEAICRAI